MSRSLFKIDTEITEISESFVDHETGEFREGIQDLLDKVEIERDEKLIQYALWYKQLKYEEEALGAEIKKFTAWKKARANTKARIKEMIQQSMPENEKLEAPSARISWLESESVEIDESVIVADLPDSCQNIAITANKTELKLVLKGGAFIRGVALVKKNNIVIK